MRNKIHHELDTFLSVAEKERINIVALNYDLEADEIKIIQEDNEIYDSILISPPIMTPNDINALIFTKRIFGVKGIPSDIKNKKYANCNELSIVGLVVDLRGNVKPTLFSTLSIGRLLESYNEDSNGDFAKAYDVLLDSKASEQEKESAFEDFHHCIYDNKRHISHRVIYRLEQDKKLINTNIRSNLVDKYTNLT